MNETDTADVLTLEPHLSKRHPLATTEPAPLQVANTSPAAIMMNALERGADLSQIERMMNLQQQWLRLEAEKAYNLALADFKAENIKITKNKLVDFETRTGRTTYMHAELAQVVDAVGPALSRHGFGWSWNIPLMSLPPPSWSQRPFCPRSSSAGALAGWTWSLS